MEIFALDLGNKQTKMVSSLSTKIFSSYFIDRDELGDTSVSLFNNGIDISEYRVNFDSEFTYIWGKELSKLRLNNSILDTINFDDRYNKHAFKLLANFAIGELAKDFDEAKNSVLECIIVTGVPTDDFNDKAVKSLMKVLNGDHNIVIDDTSLNVRVKEVRVLPQPVGSVYNEILNNEGELIRKDYLSEFIGVVDIGGGTILLDALKNFNLDTTNRKQEITGAYKLYQHVVQLATKNGINGITEYEIEQILRTGSDQEGYFYKPSRNESYDISQLVQKAKLKFTRDLINLIDKTYKDIHTMDRLLFTGGGAYLVNQKKMKQEYSFAEFVDDAEIANVMGFYKAGLTNQ